MTNFTSILTFLGLAATLIFGFASVYLVIKRRYPGRITFIREASIGLFDSIERNVPELSVLYDGKPVGENLVLLKGILQNTGSIDITESMVVEHLAIKLPEGYKWLAAKAVGSAPNVNATVGIHDSTSLTFDLGLFRCDEHIRFEAVVEVPSEQDAASRSQEPASQRLNRAIRFTHRIANTQTINSEVLPPRFGSPMLKPRLDVIVGMSLVLFLASFTALTLAIGDNYKIKDLYLINTDEGHVIRIRATDNQDGTMTLRGDGNDYSETLTNRNFYLNRYVEPVAAPSSAKLKALVIFLVIPVVFSLLFATTAYLRERRRINRFNNLLND